MRTVVFVLSWCVLAIACSGETALLVPDNGASDVAATDSRVISEVRTEPDLDALEPTADELLFGDGGNDAGDGGLVGCEPGNGCFLDKCGDNADCLSGYCVEYMGDGVCTMTCQEECPPGWSCKSVPGADVVFICVSEHANLCKPCASGDGCKSVGGTDDVCVSYEDAGSFCGGSCVGDDDCPWGFSCIDTETVDGIAVKQCVSDTGECPCAEKSVSLALWTPCQVANEFGTCDGKRICTDSGLAACDADEAVEEICNGFDDDCDNSTDEPNEAGGVSTPLCDDGNDCTQDICSGEAGCEQVALDGVECKDGNPCTVADICESGVCVGSPVGCDDDNPCTDDTCDKTGGCVFTKNTENCDDNDPCTLGDHCQEGDCLGVSITCDCQNDADCGVLEDGNLCSGTLICDTDKIPYQCVVDAQTIVLCPEAQGSSAICLEPNCDPQTGDCSQVATHEGWPCHDGDLCTVADACVLGECVAGEAVNCNDGNPCTDDYCESLAGCIHEFNAAGCNDGDVCTTGDYCVEGTCTAAGTLDCDDDNICTDDTCLINAGCFHQPNAAECDDGDVCTAGDHCADGWCQNTGAETCADDNQCTDDVCDPVNGCVYGLNSDPCDDGDPCTAGDICSLGGCTSGPGISCDDGNICTADSCAEAGGCLNAAVDGMCDDDNACTLGDHCMNGQCMFDDLANCDDDSPCTKDSCNPLVGCVHEHKTGLCEDGDLCTFGDKCDNGACVGGPALNCDDGNGCTDDSCDPAAGCLHVHNVVPCSDGNACTNNDMCTDGACLSGAPADCDDINVCTDDLCDAGLGCTYKAVDGSCDDGNACTLDDLCAAGTCTGGPDKVCNDGNVCTDDGCNPDSGCTFLANSVVCDDIDLCTIGDHCDGGACVGESTTDCDDVNECTVDTCTADQGCEYSNVLDGTECSGGVDWKCFGGNCVLGHPDLVLYYSFESGQGTVGDLGVTGNVTPGQFHGTAGFSNEAKYGNWAMRSPGGSGPDDRLGITGSIGDLNMSGSYTFMAWVRNAGGGSGQGIIVLGSCCSPRNGYTMNFSGPTTIHWWAGSDKNDSNYNLSWSDGALSNGQWHHIGVRVKPGKVEILHNGAMVMDMNDDNIPASPSQSPPNNSHALNNPSIGGQGINNVQGLDLYIDEVRVYKTWLSGDDYQQAMAGQ